MPDFRKALGIWGVTRPPSVAALHWSRMTDLKELLERAVGGDNDAVAALVQRFDLPLRAAIRHRLGAKLRLRLDTDDILQSALTEALGRLPGFEYRSEGEFLGWLAQVAERRIQMQARRHGAGRRDPRREHRLQTRDDFANQLTAPPDRAHASDVRGRLEEAVGRLPERERSVVQLHLKGKNFGEIAVECGLKDKSAARYLFQCALKKLSAGLGNP